MPTSVASDRAASIAGSEKSSPVTSAPILAQMSVSSPTLWGDREFWWDQRARSD
jgi:hypothetical protein